MGRLTLQCWEPLSGTRDKMCKTLLEMAKEGSKKGSLYDDFLPFPGAGLLKPGCASETPGKV